MAKLLSQVPGDIFSRHPGWSAVVRAVSRARICAKQRSMPAWASMRHCSASRSLRAMAMEVPCVERKPAVSSVQTTSPIITSSRATPRRLPARGDERRVVRFIRNSWASLGGFLVLKLGARHNLLGAGRIGEGDDGVDQFGLRHGAGIEGGDHRGNAGGEKGGDEAGIRFGGDGGGAPAGTGG